MLKLSYRGYNSFPIVGILLYLLCSALLSGCASETKIVGPYQGGAASRTVRANKESGAQKYVPAAEREDTTRENKISSQVGQRIRTKEDVLMSGLARINDRIFAYEEKLVALEKIFNHPDPSSLNGQLPAKANQCRRQLQDILSAYNALHEKILSKQSVLAEDLMGKESLFTIEKRDFAFLESDCNGFLTDNESSPAGWASANRLSALREAEKLIIAADAQEDYQQLISVFEKLSTQQQAEASYQALFLYGRALMKNDRQEEAVRVLSTLLARYRQTNRPQWEFELMGLLGDLLFGLEKFDQAGSQYDRLLKQYSALSLDKDWAAKQLFVINQKEHLGEEVSVYALLLKNYLSYNPKRDGYKVMLQAKDFIAKYPHSRMSLNANLIFQKAGELAEKWFAGFLEEIELLATAKKFQEAIEKAGQAEDYVLPHDKQLLLQAKINELLMAQSIEMEKEKLRLARALPRKWNKGMTALAAKEYDSAIATFTELLNTEYRERAARKIDESVRLAVREGRRRAAELFVRANRTTDLEAKKKLLLASRRLLQTILLKYPQSDLIEKVTRNLKIIEDDIVLLDASLLEDTPPLESGRLEKDRLLESKTLPPHKSILRGGQHELKINKFDIGGEQDVE